jgi:hypothetical protein
MEKFVITFGFDNDGEYIVTKSKPIPAGDEQEACEILINQFENYEGEPCDILIVNKL